jgi:hypothetical protein
MVLVGGCPGSTGIKWWATHLVHKNRYLTGVQIYLNNSPLRHTIERVQRSDERCINGLEKGKQTPTPKQYSHIVRPSPFEPCYWLMICTQHTLRHSLLQKKYPVSLFHISLFSKKRHLSQPMCWWAAEVQTKVPVWCFFVKTLPLVVITRCIYIYIYI